MRSFEDTLEAHLLKLLRGDTKTLQINTGFRCNLACKHCHVAAGPAREEVMSRKTMREVIEFARGCRFEVIDITGGAPELVEDIEYLVDNLVPLADTVIFRSNLTLLTTAKFMQLLERLVDGRVAIAASFPSTNRNQADGQRGSGVWLKSIEALLHLNKRGYGIPGTGLELFLISNPSGAFLPVDQCRAEQKFRIDLARKWDIGFTNLYTFANIPLGRFRTWLETSNNLEGYMKRLAENFNPETVAGLMCRTLISVSWEGVLYDCDFNLAAGLCHRGKRIHVSEVPESLQGIPIVTGDHCYGCTAGAGFT